ncbi:MAG: molybdenum cofactor biosynthesis protein MoaE [Conexivisphaerales archaeon]
MIRRITRRPIDAGRLIRKVTDKSAGGIVLFVGTVRNTSEAGEVKGIFYEAYKEMAEKRIEQIEEEAKKNWPIKKIAVLHRVGKLKLSEISVAVAVSSAHRKEAFEACRFIIDRIKQDAPIWKKELLKTGTEKWVEGLPISKEASTGT